MSLKQSLTPEGASAALTGARAWILTDGKAGDAAQCAGVAERLGLNAEARVVNPRALFALLMPFGPIDPRDAPGKSGSPVAGPYPDIVIASGRRAAPYVKAVKRASGGRTFTVILKDPRTGAGSADFLWVPRHDRLRGENVLATLTSPHRFSPDVLAQARAEHWLASPVQPRGNDAAMPSTVVLLIGGDSKNHRFTETDIARLCDGLEKMTARGFRVLATPSRRTPLRLAARTREIVLKAGGFWYDGQGPNPYPRLLAVADAFVITADSVNMLGEAAATGKAIYVFEPSGGTRKTRAFLSGLEQAGATRPFTGEAEFFTYKPIDSTPEIAAALASAYLRFKSR